MKDVVENLLDVPPPPNSGLEHLSRPELRAKLWASHGGPKMETPWPGPISDLYYGWYGLGRDMNGTSLHSERESWLKSHEWTDPGEAESGMYLFSVLENAHIETKQHPNKKPK